MKIPIIITALTLTGCLLDHDPEPKPGKVHTVDCQDPVGYPDPPPPGSPDTLATCLPGKKVLALSL